jgi:hypothetical protein
MPVTFDTIRRAETDRYLAATAAGGKLGRLTHAR